MKAIILTLFLLLSLSYSSTLLSYEKNFQSSIIDSFCEDIKEDTQTDKSDDRLDIWLSEIFCVQFFISEPLAFSQSKNYTFSYDHTLYKPPLFS